jgi:hypothetical protein
VNLAGAVVEGQVLALFATVNGPVTEGEVTVPEVERETLLATGLKPESKYELELTGGPTKTWGGGLFHFKEFNNGAQLLRLMARASCARPSKVEKRDVWDCIWPFEISSVSMRQTNIRTCSLVIVFGLVVQLWAGPSSTSPVFYRTRNSEATLSVSRCDTHAFW